MDAPDNLPIEDPYPTTARQSAFPVAAPAPSPGVASAEYPQQIGRYRIEKVLGEGAFGRVYLAYDDQLNRPVAIKVPRRERLAQANDAEAYLAEARVLAGLDHPNIVPVHDVGTSPDGLCYVVSKLIEGSDLAKKISATRLSYIEAADLIATVAEALHYAHRKGLVHRDIKPGNILIDTAGNAYVADFGLALKEEDVGKEAGLMGTPAYMSPEQARGEGHRVDGRSDIFSLGVVCYELLVGQRPFRKKTIAELLEQITTVEARPLRQVDDAIPMELERICLKALSRRLSERYTTAKDMAEDLRHFLAKEVEMARPVSQPGDQGAVREAPVAIVPKGLRSFDAGDADFFLELLPGPRDRDGLPESIRFWKIRIEETDAEKTCAVGLIYGPSGCGKSSLVKAGFLPRLTGQVMSVYIEATAKETEARLLKGLRRAYPELSSHLGLADTLAALRKDRSRLQGKKVLIILDQFEQWLHARRQEENPELVRALRHCDGEHVQAILMVRDDFWMGVTRFMQELEVDLVPGKNITAVDLFDERHAQKVLKAFGRAYRALPEGQLTQEQEGFLDQAVTGLGQDGKVISVRLALFAEMVKGKPWTPATLKDVGGMDGVGVTFLEETFASRTAEPLHRLHQKAAEAVLKAMLPEIGTDIKGNMRSFQELQVASGYQDRPRSFQELLWILDGDLRLITPTDSAGVGDTAPTTLPPGATQNTQYYQLTHDYLVPSLRDWLTRKQKETIRGRAELLLAERATLWAANPQNRQLPAWWEWLKIRLWTRKRDWSGPQRKMMRKAARYHAVGGVAWAALLVSVTIAGLQIRNAVIEHNHATLAAGLVRELLAAETENVPKIIDRIEKHWNWAEPLLKQQYDEEPDDSREKLHAGLALLRNDNRYLNYVVGRFLEAPPREIWLLRHELLPHQEKVRERLWKAAASPEKGHEHHCLSAACILACCGANESGQWPKVSRDVVGQLLGSIRKNPVHYPFFVELLAPVHGHLLEDLAQVFRNKDRPDLERSFATSLLAEYARDRPVFLADLLMDAGEEHFVVLFPRIAAQGRAAIPPLQETLNIHLDSRTTQEDKERLAKRQANAGVALVRLGEADSVWPLLKHRPDPRARSYLIHRLRPLEADPRMLFQRYHVEKDVSIQRALLLALGEFDENVVNRGVWIPDLLQTYRNHPDAGMHGTAEWLLRQWKQEDKLKEIDDELTKAASQPSGNRNWYVNKQGQTLSIIPGPVEFWMGSPPDEAGRETGYDGKVEMKHWRRINRSFAIASKEVTVEQFVRCPAFNNHVYDKAFTRSRDCPVGNVTWYKAAEYCNWLSAQEGIPKNQWVYEPNAQGKYAHGMKMKRDYLKAVGYRLPTEAEWEYACRAKAVTSRFYGESDELLGKYAWYTKNSLDRWFLPSRRLKHDEPNLKPNDFGLFHMLGNAVEWGQDRVDFYDPGTPATPSQDLENDDEIKDGISDKYGRAALGGSFFYRASNVRSAARVLQGFPSTLDARAGFRMAKTVNLEKPLQPD